MTKKQLQFSTRGTYIAPECNALELKSQGIICQSIVTTSSAIGDATLDDWDTL